MIRIRPSVCRAAALAAAAVVCSSLAAAPQDAAKVVGDPYPLTTCAVAGGPLDAADGPITIVHEGREIKVCCPVCAGKFKADPAPYLKTVDAAIVKAQRKSYPLTECVVMAGEPLEGEDATPVDIVHNNRLVRTCCRMCERRFAKDPAAYLKKLDAAVIAKQMESYPIDTCVVAGGKLGSMGEPVNLVIHNRLVRLCCKACEPKVRANPAKYLAKLKPAAPAVGLAGTPMQAKGVTMPTDAAWTPSAPTSSMRVAQFDVEGPAGTTPAQIVVFHFGDAAGSREANIQRWVGQFSGANGAEPVKSVKTFEANGLAVTTVTLRGSFKGMRDPAPKSNQMGLFAIVEGPEGALYFKFTGDAALVEAHQAAFEAALRQVRPAA